MQEVANTSDANHAGSNTTANDLRENVTVECSNLKLKSLNNYKIWLTITKKKQASTSKLKRLAAEADYGAALKAKFNSGDKPDISIMVVSDLELWAENLEDLSDQPSVKDLVKGTDEPMTKDGKIYGMPIGVEGYGYIYNKDFCAKADITELPKTLTQLEAAAQKLQATGITPFENGYAEWWVLGNHFVNLPFAFQEDPNAFIDGLNKGTENHR